MPGFLLNRFSQSIVLLVIVSIIGFTVLNFMPGGPLAQFGAGSRHDPEGH
ncbi:ABC-type dipeptide/oligopeptide/nickel transport system permease component [Bradyrhizobium sp. GM6.1]